MVAAIPGYKDAIQPAAKKLGNSLLTVPKAIKVALNPVSALNGVMKK